MSKGKKLPFITFEGGEGAGKSTQVKMLKEVWKEKFPNHEFVFTREPGGSLYAELLRERMIVTNDPAAKNLVKDISGAAMFALFASARFDHVERVIKPALDAGKVVVCDRFDASSYAYQLYGQASMNPEGLRELYLAHRRYLAPYVPGFTFVFDLGDPKVGLERVHSRGEVKTHFEERDLQFHENLINGYRDYAEHIAPDACRLVDIRGWSKEMLHEMVLDFVTVHLQECTPPI